MFRAIIQDGQGGTRQVRVPGWAVGLGAAGLAVAGFLILLLGAGLALLLAPVALGAVLVARWRLRRMLADLRAGGPGTGRPGPRGPSRPSSPADVIDAEYRVLHDERTR